jgi:hypothetical protein
MSKKRDYSIKGEKSSHRGRNILIIFFVSVSLVSLYFFRTAQNSEITINPNVDNNNVVESNVLTTPKITPTKPDKNAQSTDGSEIEGTLGVPFKENNTPVDQDLYIYMDGWSKIYTPGTVKIFDPSTGEQATSSFEPLSEKELKESLKKAPEVMGSMLARIYASDYKFSCTSSSCSDSRGTVDIINYLANPTSIPTLGESYKEYGMKSGVYLAKFKIHANTGLLTVSIGESNKYAINAVGKIVEPRFADESSMIIGPDNGYGKRTFGFSAAFGRIFLNQPTWVGKNPSLFTYDPYGIDDLDSNFFSSHKALPLQGGLGSNLDAQLISGLNDSQLTFYSSPVTGCGSFVLCIPESSKSSITNLTSTAFTLCTKDGTKVHALAYNADLSLQLNKPVLLNGISKKAIPDFTGKITSILDNPLPSELQSGRLNYAQRALLIYTNKELNYIVSQRSLSSLPNWGKAEVTAYLGSAFTICK